MYRQDETEAQSAEFFMQLLVTTLLVLGLVGIMLRSALLPLRILLTLVVPLLSVFGLAVVVYQWGALAWLGIAAFGGGSEDRDLDFGTRPHPVA